MNNINLLYNDNIIALTTLHVVRVLDDLKIFFSRIQIAKTQIAKTCLVQIDLLKF